MKAIVYKARENEWIVITSPDTSVLDHPDEKEVAKCNSQELGEALCNGMGWEYTVSK